MKTMTKYLLAALPVVAALTLLAVWSLFLTHVHAGLAVAMFGPLLGMKPKTFAQLAAGNRPNADEPEFYPMTWYDTQLFTPATSLGAVPYFSVTNADPSLSNMQLAGQFPADEYFDLGELHVDIIGRVAAQTAGAAASAAVGFMDDVMQLMYTSRATITLTNRNKPYGQVPLAQCRPLGGLETAATAGLFAAATSVQFGKWDATGWIFEKQITLGPSAKFGVTIHWPGAAMTLSIATYQIRVALRGVHYRLVV